MHAKTCMQPLVFPFFSDGVAITIRMSCIYSYRPTNLVFPIYTASFGGVFMVGGDDGEGNIHPLNEAPTWSSDLRGICIGVTEY